MPLHWPSTILTGGWGKWWLSRWSAATSMKIPNGSSWRKESYPIHFFRLAHEAHFLGHTNGAVIGGIAFPVGCDTAPSSLADKGGGCYRCHSSPLVRRQGRDANATARRAQILGRAPADNLAL